MSEWIKKHSFMKHSPSTSKKKDGPHSIEEDSGGESLIDSKAALDSFKHHWLQAWDIMRIKYLPPNDYRDDDEFVDLGSIIMADDVTTIVNHIDQMITLLIQESQGMTRITGNKSGHNFQTPIMLSPLLDYLLMESILDKLLNWSSNVGEFTNVMKLEQLKLYDLLVTQLCHHNDHQSALFQRPLVRPLLQLLSLCSECAPFEVEKRLVILLNSLCVCLSQNPDLLELFFIPNNDQPTNYLLHSFGSNTSSPSLRTKLSSLTKPESRFLIFSLLIPFVHREGPIGQQARDALLLIMSLSIKYEKIGSYIAENSNFCPVLATGLSGLYSSLPRKPSPEAMVSEDWHQITYEDIQETPELQMFLNSLEFCNAVVQVSHSLVQTQLVEYVYQGFLVSVIGPALHQDTINVPLVMVEKLPKYSNTLEEIIATTAYLELFLRTITEPVLLQVFLKFICKEKFDEQRILDTLIGRINANSKLCLVTLVLFRTMLELNCEDVLLELILKYLISGNYLTDDGIEKEKKLKQINDVSSLNKSAEKYLSMIPSCCFSAPISFFENYYNHGSNGPMRNDIDSGNQNSYTVSASLAAMILHNYLEYLNDAHHTIITCQKACRCWSSKYNMLFMKNSLSLDNAHDSGIYLTNHLVDGVNSAKLKSPIQQVPEEESTDSLNEKNYNKSENSKLIGPFLTNILSRLESMTTNDIYTNLQVTGLISRLAMFPQPLIRSFLLNHNIIHKQHTKSLPDILSSLHSQFEQLSNLIGSFEDLIKQAKSFFIAREERLFGLNSPVRVFNPSHTRKGSNVSAEVFVKIEVPKETRRRSLKNMFSFRTKSQSSQGPRSSINATPDQSLEFTNESQGYSKFTNLRSQSQVEEGIEASEYNEMARKQNIVLAAIVFEEFLKELSAIAQEHYILENEVINTESEHSK